MEQAANKTNNDTKDGFMANPNRRLKGYLDGGQEAEQGAAPIADLFPHCTVRKSISSCRRSQCIVFVFAVDSSPIYPNAC
jgi:hypothetical protein